MSIKENMKQRENTEKLTFWQKQILKYEIPQQRLSVGW